MCRGVAPVSVIVPDFGLRCDRGWRRTVERAGGQGIRSSTSAPVVPVSTEHTLCLPGFHKIKAELDVLQESFTSLTFSALPTSFPGGSDA